MESKNNKASRWRIGNPAKISIGYSRNGLGPNDGSPRHFQIGSNPIVLTKSNRQKLVINFQLNPSDFISLFDFWERGRDGLLHQS